MKLSYKAVGKDGKVVKGVVEAKDTSEAASILRVRGFLPVLIEPVTEGGMSKYLPFLNKLNQTEVVFFTRQLSSMLVSGLTLLQSLTVLRDQVQNPRMREVVTGVITEIQGGKQFSSAIAKYPKVFSPVYVSLIKTAESAGLLDKVLLRLADNLEKQHRLKGSIKGALTYPVIVLTGMVLVMIVMMIFVVPQLTTLYDSLGIELPLPTKIVVGMSDALRNFWPLIIGFWVIVVFGIKRWHASSAGRVMMDTIILKLPVFGKLVKQTILTEFTRTFGLLVGSGTLVVQSLEQAADVTGNIIFREAILDIAKRVEKGMTIGDAMSSYAIFPPILVQMVKIGEDTGKLDESLLKVSEYFEREVDQTVKTLTTAMEPLIMVMLGIGVAFLVISIITPIYNLTSSLQ